MGRKTTCASFFSVASGQKEYSLIVAEQSHRGASLVVKTLKPKSTSFGSASSGKLFAVKDKRQAVKTVC